MNRGRSYQLLVALACLLIPGMTSAAVRCGGNDVEVRSNKPGLTNHKATNARDVERCLDAAKSASAAQAPVPLPRQMPPPNPMRQLPSRRLPASVENGFKVAAVGDLIIAHPAAALSSPPFVEVEKLLRSADVTFGNLEGSLVNPSQLDVWVASETGGGDEYGPPLLATDIKQMGFDLVSHSNNHATDWGVRGMLDTDRTLDRAGLVHAGTGRNLEMARRPVYVTTPSGRIALVAMTSTFTPMSRAGAQFRGVAGRPGVNAIRTTRYHVVTDQEMAALREIYDTQPNRPAQPAGPDADRLDLFGVQYRTGPTPALTFAMNPYDLDAILRNIREGKEESNFEIAYIHAHEPGNWSERAPDFLPKLAHDAIDAGADEFVASGPHRLRGIEIYKGKPIFYSLGDFFYEVAHRIFVDADNVERSGLDMSSTTNYEYQQYRLKGTPGYQYESVVAISTFDSSGNLQEIKLYPVDLGYKRVPNADSGVPYLAAPKTAQRILRRLQRLSRTYGTQIAIHGDVGVITTTADNR